MNYKLKQTISDVFWNFKIKWDLTFRRNRLIIDDLPSPRLIAMTELERKEKEENEQTKIDIEI